MNYLSRKITQSLALYFFVILLGLIAVCMAIYLGYLVTVAPIIKLSDYIQIIVLFIIFCALLVTIYVQNEKEKLDESAIYLGSSIDLINKAYEVLKSDDGDVTTERVSWVTAARLLTRSTDLASKISLRSHKDIYESEHDYQRHRFSDLLKIDDKQLPIEFFFGAGFVIGDIGKSAYNTLLPVGENWIPIRVVSTVYRFKAFPEGYEDPLELSAEFSKQEMDRLWLFDERGIYDYVVFRKFFTHVSDSVYQTKDIPKAAKVTESEITTKMNSLSGRELD